MGDINTLHSNLHYIAICGYTIFLPLGEITWVRISLTPKLMVYHHLVFHENCHNLGIHKPFSITPKNAVVDQLLITYPTIIHCPYMCMCIYIHIVCIYIYVNIPWNPILNAEKHSILTSCQSHRIDPQGWKLSSPPRERGEVTKHHHKWWCF